MIGLQFYELKINDFVRFHPRLVTDWAVTLNHQIWQGEPLDCVFQITAEDMLYDAFELSCVKACGGHHPQVEQLERSFYEDNSSSLGFSLLVIADFNELNEFVKEGFNLEEDVAWIEQLICERRLPTGGYK